MPVLIQIDPTFITNLPADNTAAAEDFVNDAVRNGMRASLKTGNLLTGQLYVDLDFQKDAPAATVAEVEGYRVIPTAAGGLGELEDKATAVLDKLAALPLEQTVKNASDALASIKEMSEDLKTTLGGFGENSPLYRQLNLTLNSVRALADTLERKPNSIIFGKGKSEPTPTPVPIPRSRRH